MIKDDLTIVLAGLTGQDTRSIKTVLVSALKRGGYNVFTEKGLTGGADFAELRITSKPAGTYSDRIDIFICLNRESIACIEKRISKDTVVFADNAVVKYDKAINIPFQRVASEFGNILYAGAVAAGVICGMLGVGEKAMTGHIEAEFTGEDTEIAKKKAEAAGSGYEIGKDMLQDKIIEIEIEKSSGDAK